jgi:thioredoxin 2
MADTSSAAHPTLDNTGVIQSCPSCGQRNRLAFAKLDAESRCGKCQTTLRPPAAPVEAPSVAAFDAAIGQVPLPIVVDFWAPWCGPCHMVAPELEQVARNASGRYLVLKVNTDEVPDLGERFGIRSIPTMAVFKGGREVGRTSGARPAADIDAFIQSTLARR